MLEKGAHNLEALIDEKIKICQETYILVYIIVVWIVRDIFIAK